MDYDILKTTLQLIQLWDLILKACFYLSDFLFFTDLLSRNKFNDLHLLSAFVAKQ